MSHTLTQNVAAAVAALNDVRDALTEAGVVMTNVPASSYGEKVRSISGGGVQPTLYAPSLSRNEDTIYISNPYSNGSFVTGYKIYNGDSQIGTTASTSFTLSGLGAGTYSLSVVAYGMNFTDSPKSNIINASVFTIARSLQNLSANNNTALISNGRAYTVTLTPASGYYLPEDIVLTMGGSSNVNYTYDSYTGVITIPNVTGNVNIVAAALSTPKVRRPTVTLVGSNLTIQTTQYAKTTTTKIDGTVVYTDTEV